MTPGQLAGRRAAYLDRQETELRRLAWACANIMGCWVEGVTVDGLLTPAKTKRITKTTAARMLADGQAALDALNARKATDGKNT